MNIVKHQKKHLPVIPAKAGIQFFQQFMDSRVRGNDTIFGLVILVIMLNFFSGCSPCSKAPAGESIISVAIQNSPITLDPRIAVDADGDKIASLVCDGLYSKDEHLNIVPNLVENFEQLSDTSFKFTLRPNIVFSDGQPLTSEDVVYTFESVLKGKIITPLKSSFERIKEIVAESPEIIRIELKEPYAPFFTMLTRGIVSKKAAEAAGDKFGKAPVCAGPYKVAKFEADSVVELVKNPNYFGEQPKNSGIKFYVIKDDNIRVLKLMKGDIDLVQNGIPPMLLETVLKNKDLEMAEDTGIVMTYMGFNLTDDHLKNEKVREAIAYAVDRDELISHRFKGLAVKANSVIAPQNWAYDDSLKQYDYDPEKAKKLLDEAGFKDPDGEGPKKRFNLLYKTSSIKDRVDMARMIAYQLEKVGIGVRVEPYEWGTFFRDVKKGNFQVYTLSWVGIIDPDIFYDICHSSQMPPVGLNRDRYKNAIVDKLVEEGRITLDESKRREIYSEVQKILIKELPYLPLWYEKNVAVYRKGLGGVSLRPDAAYRTFVNLEKGN